MSKFLRWLISLTGRFFWDAPYVHWSLGTFDKESLFADSHTHPLAKLLEYSQQELFQRLYWVVLAATHRVRREEEELAKLRIEQENLAEKVGELEEAIATIPEVDSDSESDLIAIELPPKPVPPEWHEWLTVGLSLMLFLGITEFLGLDIQSLTYEQTPLLILGLAGAICINLGEYNGLFGMVIGVRRSDPPRSFQDDQKLANTIPFWVRIRTGDAATWISIAIVLLETFFAAPGLISLLPPKAAANPVWQMTVFAAAGLAALVNVVMAWGDALKEIHWEQVVAELKERQRHEIKALQQDSVYQERRELIKQRQPERPKEQQMLHRDLGATRARLKLKTDEILRQEQITADMRERARCEYERWEFAVRRWMQANPEVVERFAELYPQLQKDFLTNGYRVEVKGKVGDTAISPLDQ
ncbi:hypothetical protein [Coleofasciculus sp. FACHB-SPT9]|uniref:hypothetical protein n=1 Tax=Cyanophyceae TaxID=3028117 RepID=UPI0016847BB5|nr:hypothetical protein [Coleofasciculus sp. FACHB-SPT9]MBD1892956.1 hypothetical protein [Coleofasciculus sp. FACHB-SPT9]